jgi:hypothetical protein
MDMEESTNEGSCGEEIEFLDARDNGSDPRLSTFFFEHFPAPSLNSKSPLTLNHFRGFHVIWQP